MEVHTSYSKISKRNILYEAKINQCHRAVIICGNIFKYFSKLYFKFNSFWKLYTADYVIKTFVYIHQMEKQNDLHIFNQRIVHLKSFL